MRRWEVGGGMRGCGNGGVEGGEDGVRGWDAGGGRNVGGYRMVGG